MRNRVCDYLRSEQVRASILSVLPFLGAEADDLSVKNRAIKLALTLSHLRAAAGWQIHRLCSAGRDNGAGYSIDRNLSADQTLVKINALKAQQIL